jgi:hypothetical protein
MLARPWLFLLTAISAVLLLAGSPSSLSQISAQSARTPVVVELFTSEGCSSCPPADALLAQLDRDQPVPSADIITLGEHVDYWDQLGWHDRFSSPDITQRQRDYAAIFHLDDVFTPQIVVNGSAQFNGADSSAIKNAIAQASANTIPLHLTSVKVRFSSPVNVVFTLANPPAAQRQKVGIYEALVDLHDTTQVRAGENAGHILQHVDAVRAIAMHEQTYMNLLGQRPQVIQLPARSNPVGMRLIVFAQAKPFGPILGAVACTITAKNIDPTYASHIEVPDTPQPQPGRVDAFCPAPPESLP